MHTSVVFILTQILSFKSSLFRLWGKFDKLEPPCVYLLILFLSLLHTQELTKLLLFHVIQVLSLIELLNENIAIDNSIFILNDLYLQQQSND